MSGYTVSVAALRAAAETWDDQAEVLRGGRKRLLDAEAAVPALGDRITPAAQAYVETWIDRAKQLADAAQRHAESLQGAAVTYTATETQVEASLADLLPWLQRHGTTPTTYGGYE